MLQPQSPLRSQFAALRWRLLLSSLGVIALTLGAGAIGVYQVVARSLYGQLDQALFNLADAAAHSPPIAERARPGATSKNQAESSRDRESEQGESDRGESGQGQPVPPPEADTSPAPAPATDGDGDLDLRWQNLRQGDQTIEWFDRTGQPLRQEGNAPTEMPLSDSLRPQQIKGLRLLTVPIYDAQALRGYVRVSSSTAQLDSELRRLRLGLGWGGLVALGVCGVGSWGLMRLAMTPIESSFERLRQFTADASHELRSPLTAIKTSVEVMQSHPERFQDTDLKKMGLIASATEQMTRLVNDLLLLARLDDSRMAPAQAAAIPIDDLLDDLAQVYQLQAAAQGLGFTVELAAAGKVWGDSSQLKRLFANLLDNAIKYTPAQGSVRLRSQLQEASAVVWVEDTGIGIDLAHLPRLYDRFWQADPARSHRSGSGLGLAIAQRIVQTHQGSITITSQPGKGTVAQVKLPLS
ncbi:sensor histidine kinase [Nodosilinea nodulosa]|uniref:sensor histidine kinase n=1 Tax=Nodosilinea nodulosa TaxID=416001 RepID=UPI0002ED3DC2|nr:HAMP domain-containing sensor histidine kinase [Nodosilinea nodulosa]